MLVCISVPMVQLNLNFTHACRHTCVVTCLMCGILQKLECPCTVACNFGMCMRSSEHKRHAKVAHHKLTLGLPHRTCGVTTGTIAVGNEMQPFLQLIGFFICCNKHHLIFLFKGHNLIKCTRISLVLVNKVEYCTVKNNLHL